MAQTPSRKEIDFVSELLADSAIEAKFIQDGSWKGSAAAAGLNRSPEELRLGGGRLWLGRWLHRGRALPGGGHLDHEARREQPSESTTLELLLSLLRRISLLHSHVVPALWRVVRR